MVSENKRFKVIDGVKKGTHSHIWDNQKQHNQGIGDELWLGEVVGMLNEGVILAEEKKQLKEENEQLKLDLKVEKDGCNLYYELNEELEKENKELKLQLEAFKDKLCELGVSDVKLYGKRYYTGLEEWLND